MQHQSAEIRLEINISLGGEEHPPGLQVRGPDSWANWARSRISKPEIRPSLMVATAASFSFSFSLPFDLTPSPESSPAAGSVGAVVVTPWV